MIMAPAVLHTVELLRFEPQSNRTALLFDALISAAGQSDVVVRESQTFQGRSDVLLIWGAGAPNRFGPMAKQLANGGRIVTFDLAYWSRYDKFRVSIDGPHPQRWVMKRDWPASRFMADKVSVSNEWNPDGPVIVAGLGDKARVQYGPAVVDAWEASMMAECQRRGMRVQYRAKKGQARPIEQVLKGASACITWHSNVAVDAILMGIPVICKDGAAAAVCDSAWPDGRPQPLPDSLRLRFLYNLAHFQYGTTPTEASACWAFLREMLA